MDHHHDGTQTVADRLADHAAGIDLGAPRVELVVRRGTQRRQRRRTGIAVLAVGTVCAATITTINVLTRPTERRIGTSTTPDVSATDDTGTGSASSLRIVDSNLTWNRFDPESAAGVSLNTLGPMSDGARRLEGEGPFLTWSTTPGAPQAQMWRSDDGLSWEQAVNPPVSPNGLVQYQGGFLAFGTSPATADTSRRFDVVISSTNDGTTWDTTTLPIDTSRFEGQHGVAAVGVGAGSIAAGPNGVLAIANVSVNLDWPSLLPPEAQQYGWQVTPEGVAVNGPPTCSHPTSASTTPAPTTTSITASVGTVADASSPTSTIPGGDCTATTATTTVGTLPPLAATTVPMSGEATLTWAALGISPEVAAAVQRPLAQLFFSVDGDSWEHLPTPEGTGWNGAYLATTPSGFVAALPTDGTSSVRLASSIDGRDWTDLGAAPILGITGLATMGDRVVVSGPSSEMSNAVAVRSPDGSWTSVDLDDLRLPTDGVKTSLYTGSLAASPTGISMIATIVVDPIAEVGGVDVTRNGITMHALDWQGNFTFLDSSGTEIGKVVDGQPSGLVEPNPEAGGYVVRDDAGAEIATFDYDDLSQAAEESGVVVQRSFVIHSTDGVSWSREALTDLAGEPVSGTGGVRLTDTQVIVAVNVTGQQNPDGTPKQVLLVGTPRS